MEEQLSIEQLAEGNNMVLNVLIDFLIEKGIIGEDEFRQKLENATQSAPKEAAQAAEIEAAATAQVAEEPAQKEQAAEPGTSEEPTEQKIPE